MEREMVGLKLDSYMFNKHRQIKKQTPNWTEEIFIGDKIQCIIPITYKLKDLNDEEIQRSFYKPEILKAKRDVFRIDKVIWRDCKKKQALVKWKGYSDEFNSWISSMDLKDLYIYLLLLYEIIQETYFRNDVKISG